MYLVVYCGGQHSISISSKLNKKRKKKCQTFSSMQRRIYHGVHCLLSNVQRHVLSDFISKRIFGFCSCWVCVYERDISKFMRRQHRRVTHNKNLFPLLFHIGHHFCTVLPLFCLLFSFFSMVFIPPRDLRCDTKVVKMENLFVVVRCVCCSSFSLSTVWYQHKHHSDIVNSSKRI